MADEIVSRAMIQQKGRAAFLRGVPRDGHGMNPGALGICEWCKGWDAEADKHHVTAEAKRGLELAQVAA